MTYKELYQSGKLTENDIEKFLSQWHNEQSKTKVYEALGVSKEDYTLWLMDKTNFRKVFG